MPRATRCGTPEEMRVPVPHWSTTASEREEGQIDSGTMDLPKRIGPACVQVVIVRQPHRMIASCCHAAHSPHRDAQLPAASRRRGGHTPVVGALVAAHARRHHARCEPHIDGAGVTLIPRALHPAPHGLGIPVAIQHPAPKPAVAVHQVAPATRCARHSAKGSRWQLHEHQHSQLIR